MSYNKIKTQSHRSFVACGFTAGSIRHLQNSKSTLQSGLFRSCSPTSMRPATLTPMAIAAASNGLHHYETTQHCSRPVVRVSSFADRRRTSMIIKTAVDTCRGKVPIIAGAGGPTRFAIACAQAAEQAGAQGILLLPLSDRGRAGRHRGTR